MRICSVITRLVQEFIQRNTTGTHLSFLFFLKGVTSVKHRNEDLSESETLPSIAIACLTILQCAPIPHLFFRVAIPRVNFNRWRSFLSPNVGTCLFHLPKTIPKPLLPLSLLLYLSFFLSHTHLSSPLFLAWPQIRADCVVSDLSRRPFRRHAIVATCVIRNRSVT